MATKSWHEQQQTAMAKLLKPCTFGTAMSSDRNVATNSLGDQRSCTRQRKMCRDCPVLLYGILGQQLVRMHLVTGAGRPRDVGGQVVENAIVVGLRKATSPLIRPHRVRTCPANELRPQAVNMPGRHVPIAHRDRAMLHRIAAHL